MKQYKYILVDWDGCLARTLQVWIDTFQEELRQRNIQATDKDVAAKLGHRDIGEHFGVEDEPAFMQSAVKIASQRVMEVELYDGASALLEYLQKSGRVIALVSSSPRQALMNGVAYNNLQHIFQTIVSGDDVTKYKPDPQALEVALSAIGGTKASAIMIGDTANDIVAAQTFGIDSALVFPKEHNLFHNKQTLLRTKPTYVVEHLIELKNIL
jgi:pyrophosphatase PpaX